ncbi:transposase [Fibrobacterota bacterium]
MKRHNWKTSYYSRRLKGVDYSKSGLYLITANLKDRKQWFGKIIDNKMHLNNFGEIAEKEWLKTADIRTYVKLDEFIIMPNHIHGIIGITENRPNKERMFRRPPVIKLSLKPHSISSIMAQYKSIVTKLIRNSGLVEFDWQYRFHDHVIRSQRELDNIRAYVRNNPRDWDRKEIQVPWKYQSNYCVPMARNQDDLDCTVEGKKKL